MSRPYQQEKFAAFVRNELAKFLEQEFEAGPGVFISLLRVEPKESLASVRAWVSVWPPEKSATIEKQLKLVENRARAYLISRLSRRRPVTVLFSVVPGIDAMAT